MKHIIKSQSGLWPYITIFGIIIYLLIDILLAHLRPDYSLLHNAESDYGRGPYGWVMDLNFLLRCGLSLALVKCLWDTFPKNNPLKKASYWLIIWAVSSGLLAFFADNPYGYPHIWSGSIHLLLAFIAFVGAIVAMIQISRLLRLESGWHDISSVLLAIGFLSILAVLFLAKASFGPHRLGGLYERIFLGLVLLWEIVVAARIAQLFHFKTQT
ncbi:MAG: DUF998 domain-containing protein [Candidatus Saccharimonadales bacterium]